MRHFSDELFRFVVQVGSVFVRPVQFAAVDFGQVLGEDDFAKSGAGVSAENVDLVSCAFVEPALSNVKPLELNK